MRLTKTLLMFLFFSLPLLHGKVFETLGMSFWFSVSGNFEFTKVIFFNILSGVIFLSFFCESLYQKKKIHINKYIFVLLILLFSSTFFSLSPFHSLIWDTEKWHTALMFLNLWGLYIILTNLEKTFLRKLILTSLLSGFFACGIALKEYFFPSFHYGALWNRALGTFGHPNYLSGYLLLLIPFIFAYSHKLWYSKYILYFLLCATLFLTKSIWALFLAILYIISRFIPPSFIPKGLRWCFVLWWSVAWLFILVLFFPEKLHSFLSRFYLWESTLNIIFSDWKIFLFGTGAETLPYLFNSFKAPELYIFENFWYTADRPHNFFLNIFYHFGIFAAWVFLYFIYLFLKNVKNSPENISILLFLLYWIFHYFSIASYIIIILVISILHLNNVPFPKVKLFRLFTFLLLTLFSLTWLYYSFKLYKAEMFYAEWHLKQAQQTLTHPKYLQGLWEYEKSQKLEWFVSQNNIKSQIKNTPHKLELCNAFTKAYPSAENFFFCGNIFEELWKGEIAKKFYTAWLQKLPNLWNKDSPYWDNYFIKETITGNRFFSEKFWNIPHILDYLEIENNFVK